LILITLPVFELSRQSHKYQWRSVCAWFSVLQVSKITFFVSASKCLCRGIRCPSVCCVL